MASTKTADAPSTTQSEPCGRSGAAGWAKLRRADWIAPLLTIVFISALAIGRLPPGICFDDAGDLQLASVTLGIMHPPGYAGYATLGWFVSRVPGVNPAYMVSLACFASGLTAIWFCMLLQIRLGVSSWIAGALGLLLTAHPRVWSNLLVPEVYAPTLALLGGAAYLLVRSVRRGVRRDMLLAALLYGFALANRPPLLFMLPFFLVAWWTARIRWNWSWRLWGVSVAMGASCMLLPSCYSVAYLWLRDRPDIAYNYIEQQNAGSGELPDSTAGWRAKLDRVVWQASGRQFRALMGTTRLQARATLLRLRHALAPPQRQDILAIVTLIVIFGALITRRRCVATFAILSGMAAGALAFVFLYRVYGQAADLLPLLFSAAVFAGVALSSIILGHGGRAGTSACIGLFVLATVLSATHVSYGLRAGFEPDATEFLEQLDMQTLPRHAVIAASWSCSTPLWYAKHVLTKRDDIDIINIDTGRWQERIAAMPHRPAFAAIPDVSVDGFTLVPFRNIRQLERIGG